MIPQNKLTHQKILLRADLDVAQPSIASYRLASLLPSLNLCLENADKTLIIGHLGRPQGKRAQYSLEPIKTVLEQLTNTEISFIDDIQDIPAFLASPKPVAMLQNLRFFKGELALDPDFAKSLTQGFAAYIYDSFAHYRPSASLNLVPKLLPTFTGLQFDKEVISLQKVLAKDASPSLLILSGAKDDKLKLLPDLASRFDHILVGGSIAPKVDSSLKRVTPASLTDNGLDVSKDSLQTFDQYIKSAKTIVLNGPVGKFEDDSATTGTKHIFSSLKSASAYTLLGGGDTLAAIDKLGFHTADFSFVSTGGGAMLEFLRTNTHPLLQLIN